MMQEMLAVGSGGGDGGQFSVEYVSGVTTAQTITVDRPIVGVIATYTHANTYKYSDVVSTWSKKDSFVDFADTGSSASVTSFGSTRPYKSISADMMTIEIQGASSGSYATDFYIVY